MGKNLILYGKSFNQKEMDNLTIMTENLEDLDVILLEDACLQSINDKKLIKKKKKYTLREDILARGLSVAQISKDYEVISYLDLIDLIEETERVISIL